MIKEMSNETRDAYRACGKYTISAITQAIEELIESEASNPHMSEIIDLRIEELQKFRGLIEEDIK